MRWWVNCKELIKSMLLFIFNCKLFTHTCPNTLSLQAFKSCWFLSRFSVANACEALTSVGCARS